MSIIKLTNFSHSFGDKVLFQNTDFELNPHEKIGLIGLNGAGKSTLIKIIMGEVLLDSGSIEINKKYTIKYLDQYASLDGKSTIKQYLCSAFKQLYDAENKLNIVNEKLGNETNESKIEELLSTSGKLFDYLDENNFYAIDSNIQKVASGLGVLDLGLDTFIFTLSGGQRAKVMLCKLLLEQPDVMVLDEPTNFLDVSHIEWLSKFIVSSDKSFIIVSHDESFINAVATHICDVDSGKITRYDGNLDKCKLLKESNRILLQKTYANQQVQVKKLEDYIAKNKARASTAKMAHSREKMLSKIELVTPPSENVEPTFVFDEKKFDSTKMLKVENLMVGYTYPLFKKSISFELHYLDRLAIVGFNGIGKSTLLKTILSLIPKLSGSIDFSKNVVCGYYCQENDFNLVNITAVQYMLEKFPKLSEKEARRALSKVGLNSTLTKKPIKTLSGGEQSKIKLCVLSLTPCNLLVLDEPTNHLDALAISHLGKVMKIFKGAIIFVSHSKDFVKDNATKIIDLENNI